MPQADVKMTVHSIRPDIRSIAVDGEITAFAEEALMNAYQEASGDGVKTIILNFDGLKYMNSSGIGLLVTMLIRAQRQNQSLAAVGLNEHYRRIFELTRLNEAISIHPTEADAIAAVQSSVK